MTDRIEWLNYLTQRMGDKYHEVIVKTHLDFNREILVAPLYDFGGKQKGFLQYNWKGVKKFNSCLDSKYYTIQKDRPLMWGLEFLNPSDKYVFVCEGFFDSIKLMQYGSSLAALSNYALHFKQQLSLLPQIPVIVCDGDSAGRKLARGYNKEYIVNCPDGLDPGDMSKRELENLLEKYLK